MDLLKCCVVEVVKYVCRLIYPKIENTVHFSSNVENLRKEMEKLTKFRDDIKGKVEVDERDGYKPKPDVLNWLDDVEKLENEWESMQDSIAEAKRLAYKCCPNCILRSEVSTQVQKIQDQICPLIETGKNFGSNLKGECRVELIPVTSLEGQSAATKNLHKIQQLLEDDKVCIIGVWGTGGIGKTTLVKNLNNELRKIDMSRSKLHFGVVVWVSVPKPPVDIRNIQAQIAKRLKMEVDNEGSVESTASKIYQRLKQEESFLLILDDVWEVINLDHVGVPQPEDTARSKVIITSRFSDVCKQMKSDTELKVYTLDEDESWQLFVKNAGADANLEHIQPLAKEIARECDGLPLAITVIGASMRGKKRVELWKDALNSLRMSEPHNKVVEDKLYMVIKLSFDSLVSQDVESSSEQRSKHVNKKRGDIQSCFLYCSLYPAVIPQDDIIHSWWAEGFLGEHHTYEEAYNRGIFKIESLKDACLLEAHDMDSVKMHDVVRDVARWIDNSSGNEDNSLIQAGSGLTDISRIKMSASVKRISFISNEIERVPDRFMECPEPTTFHETTTLLLQDNDLQEIPHEFFVAFPALRVLNLSQTDISALPSSISSLYQLRALILQKCFYLKELPHIGNLCKLQVLDCDDTELHRPPQGMDKLINLELLNLHVAGLDNLSVFNGDCRWMNRLKRFCISVGEHSVFLPFNESRRMMICVYGCEIFSNGELSGMLQFAAHLYLYNCMGLKQLIANNSFDGLKVLRIRICSCDFTPVEEGSGQFDPLPNLEILGFYRVSNLKSVSDFSQLLGLRFSKLRKLDIAFCARLTCLFNVGGAFSVPNHLKEITINNCKQLLGLFVQCGSSQTTLVNSEIPRVRELRLDGLPKLGTFGEPQSVWEHLDELSLGGCGGIRKLPLSIQTSNNIKSIEGSSEWWSQLEWDDNNFKSNLEHCFRLLEGLSAATKNLRTILKLLEDDKVCIIGVWGTGGIGKTTLVKNLNNELQKIDMSRSKLHFGVVVWVSVPKPPIDISNIQAQIAKRLKLEVDNEGNVESTASKIYQRLKQEESFLLILDDVWEVINLDHVGVPQPEDTARSKVIITSRFLRVCKQMKSDTELNVSRLDEG